MAIDMNKEKLIELAIETREKSYSPYSGFKVGAALLAKSGRVYFGTNVENSSFSATNCAERSAIFSAVSGGEREFSAIAIVGGKEKIEDFCPPCGVCRQVMSEFCAPDFKIYLFNGEETKEFTIGQLLPESFKL